MFVEGITCGEKASPQGAQRPQRAIGKHLFSVSFASSVVKTELW